MTTFLQKMSPGIRTVTTPVPKNITAMVEPQRLIELERDDPADPTGHNQFVNFLIKRRIPQHQPEGERSLGFHHGISHRQAIFQRRGQRLFAKDIFFRPKRLYHLPRVKDVPRPDEDPVHLRVARQRLLRFCRFEIVPANLTQSGQRLLIGIVRRLDHDPARRRSRQQMSQDVTHSSPGANHSQPHRFN